MLSVIFGIFGSFGIEIGDPKKNWSKIFRRKKSENFSSKIFWDQQFSIEHFFDQNFGRPKIFDKNFSTFCFDIFFRRKFFRQFFFGSPISIPNDPKIPKIILRTTCDHYKNTNIAFEKKTTFFSRYLPSGGTQVREPSV